MASWCSFPDIWAWIRNLPPITQWRTNSMSICICSSLNQPPLKLSIAKSLHSPSLFLCILADLNLPISLWTSKQLKLNPKSLHFLDEETISSLLSNFIEAVLNYGPSKIISLPKMPKISIVNNVKEIFNLCFLTLTFLICIYEAPSDIRCQCLSTLKGQLTSSQSREASKLLMRLLGSNTEEQWMRSLNLAITNWIVELQIINHPLKTPSPMFSYAISTTGLWKIQLYCPIIAMDIENRSNSADERLLFSLMYHQLEGVIQLNYKVLVQETWIGVLVNTDNIRCDVIRIVNENLMTERGAGPAEKHFPSKISLQLTPIPETTVQSVSVSRSSENPIREIGLEKALEGSLEPTNLGLNFSASETITLSFKPWKFEQSVYGNTADLNWFLHDGLNGREVVSSKPSVRALFQPKAWFKDRYSSAYRPFTKQGGVIFANDEYGENVQWKMEKCLVGKTMEWEIKGQIWLTYWPNKHRTLYTETRRLEFREILHLTLA